MKLHFFFLNLSLTLLAPVQLNLISMPLYVIDCFVQFFCMIINHIEFYCFLTLQEFMFKKYFFFVLFCLLQYKCESTGHLNIVLGLMQLLSSRLVCVYQEITATTTKKTLQVELFPHFLRKQCSLFEKLQKNIFS